MKRALALVLASGCLTPLNRPLPHLPTQADVSALDQAAKRARARRDVGVALAVPGVAVSVLGWVLIAYGGSNPNLSPTSGGGGEIFAGIATGLVGMAVSIPGVALWISGQDAMDVTKWRRAQLAESGL
jgi:hypothetical protein